ncbi:MAG: ATP-binding cassette domain-containing protein [Corynebacterium sp.]|nr:ATP-binding cassette domain-containing protein [Corynebacterium sp.]
MTYAQSHYAIGTAGEVIPWTPCNALRLRPGTTAALFTLTLISATLTVLIFPLLGSIIDALSSRGSTQVFAAIMLPTLMTPLTDFLAQKLQFDFLALGKETIVELSTRNDERARQVDDNIPQWWFRDCATFATTVLALRISALVAFITVARWNLLVASVVLLAFILNGYVFKKWLVADVADDDIDAYAARSILHHATHNSNGESIHFRTYGFLAHLYAAHAAEKLRKATQARGRTLGILVLSTILLMEAITWACIEIVFDISNGVVGPGLIAAIIPVLLAFEGAGPTSDAGVAVARAGRTLNTMTHLPPDSSVPHSDAGAKTASIVLNDVSVVAGEREILSGISLTLRSGEFIGLVGPNGAGKTTLLRTIAGLIPPTSGIITSTPPVMVLQDPPRFPLSLAESSLSDNVTLEHLLDSYGLSVHDDPRAGLSGGQWQRLAIARAHAHVIAGRRVMVLDEPFAALDACAEQQIAALLQDIRIQFPELIIVMSTHRLGILMDADRIIVLNSDRIEALGTHDELMQIDGMYATAYTTQRSTIHGT